MAAITLRPLACGGLVLLPAAAAPPAGRSVWVFLALGRFTAKGPVHEPWIVLDFLGFSRPNLDLSMGYAA